MTSTSTRELLARLQRHYIKPGQPLPGGIFLPEVGWNGASGGGCDAIYVGFTITSGRILIGHELKVSRADWLSELNKPGKADAWADQCHEWWLVVADSTIIHEGELPPHWGLMVPGPSKTRMKTVTRAVRKDPVTHVPSWLAVRSIMARQDTLRAKAIAEARQRAYEEHETQVRERVERETQRRAGISPEVERARELISQLSARRKHLSEIDAGLVDAVCEALEGRRLVAEMRVMAKDRIASIRRAMEQLESSWRYKQLLSMLEQAGECI